MTAPTWQTGSEMFAVVGRYPPRVVHLVEATSLPADCSSSSHHLRDRGKIHYNLIDEPRAADTMRMSGSLPPDSSPRIAPEPEPSDEQQSLLSKTLLDPSSEPLNLFRVLVRYPELMKRVNALGGLFMAHGSLDHREREIVILRVAWNTGCEYEFAQHAPIARRVGLSDSQISDLGKPEIGDGWSTSDLALVRFTDEVTGDLDVTDETWASVANGHTEDQMMELVVLAGHYRMLAGFLKVLRVPLEPEAAGFPAS